MKAVFLLLLEGVDQVGRPGAHGDGVGCAAVLHLVHGELAHVHQTGRLPAQRQGDLRAARRQGQLAVAVVQGNVELVALVATAQGQG
ncbi:hypothetical protein D3C71_1917500 [compost metagenome]